MAETVIVTSEEPKKSFMDYLKFNSVTFWAGLLLICSGLLELANFHIPGVSDVVRPLLATYFGTSGAVPKILLGLGFIGVRRKLAEALGPEVVAFRQKNITTV